MLFNTFSSTIVLTGGIRGGSRAAAVSKMECFVIIVYRFHAFTKHSILDVGAALDSSLEILSLNFRTFFCQKNEIKQNDRIE